MKKDEIEIMLLRCVQRAIQAGNTEDCLDLGFRMDELREIRAFDVELLGKVSPRIRKPLITAIGIDKHVLQELRRYTRQAREVECTIDSLLKAGAGTSLLEDFFGLNRQEVSDRKKLLGLKTVAGRPGAKSYSKKEKGVVLDLLKSYISSTPQPDRVLPVNQSNALIGVSELTSIMINDVWKITKEYMGRGEFRW